MHLWQEESSAVYKAKFFIRKELTALRLYISVTHGQQSSDKCPDAENNTEVGG